MKKGNRKIVLLVLVGLNSPLATDMAVPAQDGELVVEDLSVGVMNDTLVVSAQFRNLFSRKIVGTIQSGLPSIVQIELRLLESNRKGLAGRMISRSIEYDIWEERYSVKQGDSTLSYTDFDTVKAVSGRLVDEKLMAIERLQGDLEYVVQVRVGIIPISTQQADKISDWLLNPNETEESLTYDSRSSGFTLNLSRLVSFFVGNERKSRYRSAWHSQAFTLNSLVR